MVFEKDRSSCSPYLVVPMVILLMTVTVRYMNVTKENAELASTLEKMNTMLKVCMYEPFNICVRVLASNRL